MQVPGVVFLLHNYLSIRAYVHGIKVLQTGKKVNRVCITAFHWSLRVHSKHVSIHSPQS